MEKFTKILKYCSFLALGLCFIVLSSFEILEDDTSIIQSTLQKFYDINPQIKELKRFEIIVTNNGFCRYRKFYNNGKQEYFAMNLSKLKTLDYYGTITNGELYLRAYKDDVIVQTRNDRRGDIDSMGTFMVIPLKNIDESQLNELVEKFKRVNLDLLANLQK